MKKIIPVCGALILLMFIMTGCDKSQDKNQTTICFAFQDLETEFWVAAHKAITSSIEKKGMKVIERNASQDANRQLEQIRDALAQDVDGIIMIPQDGESAVTIISEANDANVPIAVFNRPPADSSGDAIVIVADNEIIAEGTVDYLVAEAVELNRRVTPLLLVGDLGDPNAVERRNGFYNALNKKKAIFNEVVEVPTKWDANTTLANLEAALQTNPDIDLIFTSSDFLYPQIRVVLEPLGKWKPRGEKGHIILGGLDGDLYACKLMKEGFVDATGVQDLYFEANSVLDSLLIAIKNKQPSVKKWIVDPGFTYTQENLVEREADMWGCILLNNQ
jgi:ABC-type sugar transport system substrate-binding protein